MSCDKKPYGLGDSVRIGDHFDTCNMEIVLLMPEK